MRGVLYFLSVTKLDEWLAIRKQLLNTLLNHPEWSQYFKGFSITPFALFEAYQQAFKVPFNTVESEYRQEPLSYSEAKFRAFISSWLPEIRHLKAHFKDNATLQEQKVSEYLDQLIALIPNKSSSQKALVKTPQAITFPQLYTTFYGIKKSESQTSDTRQHAATSVNK